MRVMRTISVVLVLSIVAALVVLLPGAGAQEAATPSEAATPAGPVLLAPSEAAQVAAQWIGISQPAAAVSAIMVEGDQTPFVHALLEGHKCYLVTFSGVNIPLPWGEDGGEIMAAIHGLNALVDAQSKQVLRVWSTEWLDPPSSRRAIRDVEGKIGLLNGERWSGLPTTPPKVTLLQALRDPERRITTYMEQLDAYYVTSTCEGATTSDDTWQIIIHQQTPLWGSLPEQLTPYPIYGWRLVVSGQTGAQFTSSSVY